MTQKKLFNIEHLQKYYPIKKTNIFQKHHDFVKANKDISLEIYEGETLGIVGESGCGKSTFGRTLIQLQAQTGGSTMFYGETLEGFIPKYVKETYKNLAKTSKTYDADLQALLLLEDAAVDDAGFEAYRLKRIDFDTKYGNVLRLAGGLLAHDDLDDISRRLLKRYTVATEVAKLRSAISFESERVKLSKGEHDKELQKIAIMKEKKRGIQQALDHIEAELEAIRETLKTHPKFSYFESFADNGIDLASLTAKEMRSLRHKLQIIFQDPYSSLDPRMKVGDIIGEGVLTHGLFESKRSEGYIEYIETVMEQCGLDKSFRNRYPHQFSGGQRQRIGIARAVALKPKFIVCDEAVSALDVSVQSQIINLLHDLKQKENLTYLFITHDLGVVRTISDRIGVMYFGNLVELAPAQALFDNPQHPYTKRLIAAIPRLNPDEAVDWETDSRFEFFFEETGERDKDWFEVTPGHFVACHLKEGVDG